MKNPRTTSTDKPARSGKVYRPPKRGSLLQQLIDGATEQRKKPGHENDDVFLVELNQEK